MARGIASLRAFQNLYRAGRIGLSTYNAARRSLENGGPAPALPPDIESNTEPYTTADINGIFSGDDEELANSILHKHTLDEYQSTKYNIQLSLVGDIMEHVTENDELKNITNRHFIASSDTAGADPEVYGDKIPDIQYFIKGLQFKTINAISLHNPETANSAIFSMKITEPYGFSLDRTIRRAAIDLGYSPYFPPNRFVFRLDIWFSGYRSDGQFIERIPVINPYPIVSAERTGAVVRQTSTGPDITSVGPFGDAEQPDYGGATSAPVDQLNGEYVTETMFTYFVNVISLSSELGNGASTEYELSMIPVSDVAMYPEYDTVGMNDLQLDTESRNTLGEYVARFQESLNLHYFWSPTAENGDNLANIQLRTYQINLPDELQDAEFDQLPDTDSEDGSPLSFFFGASGKSIREDLFNKISYTSEGREALLSDTYPREIYTIQTRIDYSEATDENIELVGDLTGYIIHYDIVKKIEYRYTPPSVGLALDWANGAEERIRQIVGSGALKKIYKYVFSGDNTTVSNFSIKENVFWHTIASEVSSDFRYHSALTSINQEQDNPRVRNAFGLFSQKQVNRTVNDIIGNNSYDTIFPYRMNPVRISPPMLDATTQNVDEGTEQETLYGYALYQEQLENTIRTQSVVLENLEIRGDPQWLASLYSLNNNLGPNESRGPAATVNNALAADIIYFKLLYPSQSEYMNPESDFGAPILINANYGGFYQIHTVEHIFEGGLYKQNLTGFRLSQDIGVDNNG